MSALEVVSLGSGRIVEALVWTSLQGALFIAVIWLVCRLVPRLPAGVRCGLWWAACLKLLVGLVWISPVEVPLLPAATLTSPALLSQPPSRPPGEEGEQRMKQRLQAPSLPAVRGGGWERGGWGSEGSRWRSTLDFGKTPGAAILALLWLTGLAIQSIKALRQLRFTRGVVRRAEPLEEGWIRTVFAELCSLLALRRRPELRGSREVRTPQAMGLLRPLVLLPESGLARLSPAEVSMTLCHELVHLRRGDLWFGWVPALAHRIFFFHPLAALAAREYAIAREAACDAEVLRVLGSAPQAYGRLLLQWGVAPRETGLAAAGASPSLQNLKRRLQMLQQTSDSTSDKRRRLSGWWWLAGAAVLVGLIPLRIVAQAPEAEVAAAAEVAATAEPAEAPAAIAEGISGGIEGAIPDGVEGGIPGGAAALVTDDGKALVTDEGSLILADAIRDGIEDGVPDGVKGALAPVATLAEAAPRPAKEHGFSWSYSDDGDDSYVLLYGNGSSTMMSGSIGTLEKVKRLRGDSNGDILWFRQDGKEYVVRDAAVLKQVKEIFRPQMELGAKQGALGARQGELGAKQGALGAKQGELGGRQGAIGARMASLAAERLGRDDDSADLESRQRQLEAEMEELSRKQEELGRQQEALGRQQEELGRQQEELGRQQEAASREVRKEFRVLVERAVQSGAAQPVR